MADWALTVSDHGSDTGARTTVGRDARADAPGTLRVTAPAQLPAARRAAWTALLQPVGLDHRIDDLAACLLPTAPDTYIRVSSLQRGEKVVATIPGRYWDPWRANATPDVIGWIRSPDQPRAAVVTRTWYPASHGVQGNRILTGPAR